MRRTHNRRVDKRSRGTLRGGLLLTAVGAFISITVHGEQARKPAAAAARADRPVINRTVPRVAAPPARPLFSAEPQTAEITRARVFTEPLVALGTPGAEENRALAAAVTAYSSTAQPFAIEPFTAFLAAHPASAWRASLLANLGGVHRYSGYHMRALKSWEDAWLLAKDDMSAHGRAVADIAIAGALDMLATLGHVPGLDRWLERAKDRHMTGPAASRADRARETRAFIAAHPDRVVASGPKAIEILLHWRGAGGTRGTPRDNAPPVPAVLKDYRPTAAGTALSEVRSLASKVGMSMKAVRRLPGAPLVTPAILHLGFDHYSAVLQESNGRYLVRDPALRGEVWMPREALEEEMSGFALVPADTPAEGWADLTDAEAAAVIGHSCPPGLPDPDECPCPESEPGMPTYSLHPTQASVLLSDTPLLYSPPRGPAVSLQLRYNHREENQPQIFPFTNLGARWTLNWASYLEEVPFTWFNQGGALAYAQPEHIAVHVPQGGVERYTYGYADGTYPRHYRSGAVLALVSSNPLTYERRHTDGSKEIFGLSDGGVPGTRRVFLTSIVDPHGQALQFTWDAQLRLVALTDALGQVTSLQYENSDPLKVTSVTDPFGRVARFTYDAAGHMDSVTDVINLTSRFVYGESDFIAALQTPYGTTSFRQPYLAGEYKRAIEATDPLGAVERVEFHWNNGPVPATAPAADVPPGFESRNADLNAIMSLHWAKGRNVANVQEAVASRWLLRSMEFVWDPGWTVNVPHTVQRPGEARTWYVYTGSTARPSHVARKLPDGSVYEVLSAYNLQDNVTSSRDPVGRQMTYTYASNGIDLLEVRNTTAGRNDLIASYSNYTAGHLPQTMTDGAGQVTQTTFNAFGQVLTITNAKQETTTYTYDSNGYLQSIAGAVAGAIVTYTYDALGRPLSVTAPVEGSVITEYDALDRPTRTTHPDGTYELSTYDKLDVATARDRRGGVTRYTYNARRQLIAVTDPGGRTLQQHWADCDVVDGIVEGGGNATRRELDGACRLVRETRIDGTVAAAYTYDKLGRVSTMTDAKQQVSTYTYNADSSVQSIVYTNAVIPTPSVSWTYDPAYPRLTTMHDGSGTTAFAYHAAGQPGAGRVASVDGPQPNDTISYAYDQLGRVVNRVAGGTSVSFRYDALGRHDQEVNPVGTFAYTFEGVTSRVETISYPNNQTSSYSYLPASQGGRPQSIHHRYPGGATLSRFDYTYDAAGNILSWRQQRDAAAVAWQYGYDAASQLTTAVKRDTDPQGPTLQRLAYGYDQSGNRLFEQNDDAVQSWTRNATNRLVSRQAGGVVRVAGNVNEPAVVSVQGRTAAVDASGEFIGALPVAAGTTRFTVRAVDASGNAAEQSFDVDQAGPTTTYSYDANGNVTSDGIRTFEWDAMNRLTAVNHGTLRTEFSYDGNSRRVRIVEREAGAVVDDTRFLWCGATICRSTDASGPTTEYFTFAARKGGTPLFLVHDHLGSVREVTDATGAVRARYDYTPWGKRTKLSGDLGIDLGFTGHYLHAATDLYLALYRVYDPASATWLSEDPNGMDPTGNLYSYVLNSPLNYRDPLGLVEVRWQGNMSHGDPDTACNRRTGGACTTFQTAGAGSCKQQPDCKWKGSTIFIISYSMTVWGGSYPYKTGAVDKNVKDPASAENHEWVIHLLPGERAAVKTLKKFEQKKFDTEAKCTTEMKKAIAKATKDFSRAAKQNPL